MLKVNSGSVIVIILIGLYIFGTPMKSDAAIYMSYYEGINIRNFWLFSLDPGFSLYMALCSLVGVPFFFFWKLTNVLCCFAFYAFFVPQSRGLTFSAFFFILFLLVFPTSPNLFNNLLRNTISIAICLYLISHEKKLVFFVIPVLFHVSAILLVLAVVIQRLSFKLGLEKTLVFSLIFLPSLHFFAAAFLQSASEQFVFLRTIRHNLVIDYIPSFRYLSYTVYVAVVVLSILLFSARDKADSLSNLRTQLLGDVKVTHLYILLTWFSLSLLAYWSFWGIGASARILAFPVWTAALLYFSAFWKILFELMNDTYKSVR